MWNYKCRYCGKYFKTFSDVIFHEISDHPNNEIVLLTKGTMVPESLTWYLMSKQEIDLSNGHIKL